MLNAFILNSRDSWVVLLITLYWRPTSLIQVIPRSTEIPLKKHQVTIGDQPPPVDAIRRKNVSKLKTIRASN
ncbi:MAG: hypothetical protein CL862_09320 [Cyanobium sp. NAT70]|nr:hypothetical protein [Cyanobium sp. NAT70]